MISAPLCTMREFYASRDALPDLGFGSGFSICVLSEHNILFDTKTFLYNIKHLSMIIWMSSLHFKEKSQLENICHCGWTWQGAAGVERGQEHESDVCFTQTLLTQLHISLVVLWSERERERGGWRTGFGSQLEAVSPLSGAPCREPEPHDREYFAVFSWCPLSRY